MAYSGRQSTPLQAFYLSVQLVVSLWVCGKVSAPCCRVLYLTHVSCCCWVSGCATPTKLSLLAASVASALGISAGPDEPASSGPGGDAPGIFVCVSRGLQSDSRSFCRHSCVQTGMWLNATLARLQGNVGVRAHR